MEFNAAFVLDEEKSFDCFCRRVLKNERIDIYRKEKYRNEHEVSISDENFYIIKNLLDKDVYDIFRNVIEVCGFKFFIADEAIFSALSKLSYKARSVILLSYWIKLTDIEIGRRLGLPRSTVWSIRNSAIKKLHTMIGGI